MKANKIIILSIVSIALTSCFSNKYRFITHVERNGTCRAEFHEIADSLSSTAFSHWRSYGWEVSQSDTVANDYMLQKNRKNIIISKTFTSVNEMTADSSRNWFCLSPKESLKKRFRWFYTYYDYKAVYPEITNKGRVPMEQYLNKDEQKFYLQGDLSIYRGKNFWELKEFVNEMDDQFMSWYSRTLYEECFDIILQYADADFRLQLPAIKDSLYSEVRLKLKYENFEFPSINEICMLLDKFFDTDIFSKLNNEKGVEMDKILEVKTNETDELQQFEIQYELTLPGTIMTTNAEQQNDGTLVWKINMLKFLADDYTLAAESRTANVWAFVVTLLLVVFSVYCLVKSFRIKV